MRLLKKLKRKIILLNRRYVIKSTFSPEEKVHLDIARAGYLNDIGWTASRIQNKSIDKNGNALPWVTYPFIDLLESRLKKDFKLFEFGSGNSTFYYSERVNSVVSVEHDKAWYEQVSQKIPANVELIFKALVYGGEYCQIAGHYKSKFDLIIVDGRDRVNCVKQSLPALSDEGIIVLDDSERPQYNEAHVFLIANGFKELGFWGTAPIINYKKCTSIFYKEKNCFNI